MAEVKITFLECNDMSRCLANPCPISTWECWNSPGKELKSQLETDLNQALFKSQAVPSFWYSNWLETSWFQVNWSRLDSSQFPKTGYQSLFLLDSSWLQEVQAVLRKCKLTWVIYLTIDFCFTGFPNVTYWNKNMADYKMPNMVEWLLIR